MPQKPFWSRQMRISRESGQFSSTGYHSQSFPVQPLTGWILQSFLTVGRFFSQQQQQQLQQLQQLQQPQQLQQHPPLL